MKSIAKQGKRKRRRTRNKNGNGGQTAGHHAVVLMGISGRYYISARGDSTIPDAMVGWTRFNTTFTVNNAGSNFANSQLRVTSLATGASGIDPDGSTTTTNLIGVIKQLFLYYRVVAFRCRVTVQGQDAIGCQVWVGLTAARLGKNNSTNPNFVLNKGFKEAFIPPVTSSTAPTNPKATRTFLVKGNLITFNGSEQCYVDDNYCALTGGTGTPNVPTNNVYLHVGAQGTGANFTNGLSVTVTWEQEVVYFERDPQVS